MLAPWFSRDGAGLSDGPVASLRVHALVSRARDTEAIASQLKVRRAMMVPSGGDELGQGYRQCVATLPDDLGPFCDI